MSKDAFKFKQFTVFHNHCAMKVGADAVLLGAWANCNNCHTVLDIGTGSGIIALMLAQRTNAEAKIYGLEINHKAFLQACENATNNPWPEKITMLHGDFLQFGVNNLPEGIPAQFDLMVSNPPYFQNHLLPPNAARANARHNTTLSHTGLLQGVAALLSPGGLFCVILPASETEDFLHTAHAAGLHCQEKVAVKTLPYKPVSRYLLQLGNTAVAHLAEQELITGGAHPTQFTPQCKALTAPFYLHL